MALDPASILDKTVETLGKLIGLVQDWPIKWLFQVKFFSLLSAWIFACAFRFSRKTFSCFLASLHFVSEKNNTDLSDFFG